MHFKFLFALLGLLGASLVLAACTRVETSTPAPIPSKDIKPLTIVPYRDHFPGDGSPWNAELQIALEERIRGAAADAAALSHAAVLPLTEAEGAAFLDTVPALASRPPSVALSLPVGRRNPPPTGGVEAVPFPPEEQLLGFEELADHTLQVVRHSPSQDVGRAAIISLTFSLPMVPLTSQAELAQLDLPVSMTPEVSGTWSWVGTRTLMFKAEGRLPGATTFEIEVPAGFASEIEVPAELAAAGFQKEVLEFPFSWSFSTAPLALVQSYPDHDAQPLRPFIALEFNQAIDIAQLQPFLSVQSGGQEMEFVVIRRDVFDLPEDLQRFLEGTHADRTVVLQPLQDATPNTTITVAVAAGAPSAEGPLLSPARELFTFRTFGGLEIVGQSCAPTGRDAYDCQPGEPFYIAFNHGLEVESLQPDHVGITPPLQDGTLTVYPWGDIEIMGQSTANTIYTLVLQPGLRDVFGQTFSAPQEIRFSVGEARPWLQDPGVMKVLSAAHNGIYPIYARNLRRVRVQVYKVEPGDWGEYLMVRDNLFQRPWSVRHLFGSGPMVNEWLDLEASPEGFTKHDLDLAPYLDKGKGNLVVFLTPARRLLDWATFIETRAVWVQSTAINLEAYADEDLLVVRASDLETGASRPEVTLTLQPHGAQQQTDSSGHAVFALDLEQAEPLMPSFIEARLDANTAILPRSYHYSHRTFWRGRWRPDPFHWHLFTDRHLYQPTEEVHVKGWLRHIDLAPNGDVGFTGEVSSSLTYTVQDARGIEIGAGAATLNRREALDFAFEVPADANAGTGHICLQGPTRWGLRQEGSHLACTPIEIQEFRRPEFDLTLSREGSPQFLDTAVPLELQAKYYGGGPLASAEVSWEVFGNPVHYAPPGWDKFAFGGSRLDPWDHFALDAYGWEEDTEGGAVLNGILSMQGRHGIDIRPSMTGSPVTHMLHVNATVQDISQQTQTTTDQFLIHPSNQYVGARTQSFLLTMGATESLSLVVVDVHGEVVPDQAVTVLATLRDGTGNETLPLDQERQTEARCEVVSSQQPVTCELVLTEAGLWDFRISTVDPQGRENVTLLHRHVVGKSRFPATDVGRSGMELVPDQASYVPGDTARILVQSPFLPAYGTMLVNRGGILTHESLEITESPYFLEIPIEDGAYFPNLTVSVYLSGAALREGDETGRTWPHGTQGSVDLSIPPVSRVLNLDLDLASVELTPRATAEIEIRVTDARGRPVPDAEIVLLAVDEAILSLAGYQYRNPIETFYPHRYRHLSSYQLGDLLLPPKSQATDAVASGRGGMGGGAMVMAEMGLDLALMPAPAMADSAEAEAAFRSAGAPSAAAGTEAVTARRNFNPLATFWPAGATDSEGRFTASWDLPDLVGQYRVVAMATSGPRLYGLAETSLVSRLPLQIRAQLPRFLNYGDTAQLQLILENQTLSDQAVTLLLQSNGLSLSHQRDGLSYDAVALTVPAQSRQLVVRPAKATQTGLQQMLASVFNDQVQDHLQVELPVFTPAAKEGFATYGTVEDEVVLQTFQWPADIHPEFGALSIGMSSTLLQTLADGYLDVQERRWLNIETLGSRILANSALREVVPAFALPDLPSGPEIDASVQADILQMQGYQNPDGGFPLWPSQHRHVESWPFVSVYALHALVEARAAGYDVSDRVLTDGLSYLVHVRRQFPSYYSRRTRDLIESYALYIRALQRDVDPQAALRIVDGTEWQTQSAEALAWSIQVLALSPGHEEKIQEIWDFLLNQVHETAGKAVFATAFREEEGHLVLNSTRYAGKRAEALLLQALIKTRPAEELMPKLVSGLLADRRRGHWGSTQNNVFVILAMRDYYYQFEDVEPDFFGRAWLDDTLVYNEEFVGRSLTTRQAALPNSWLAQEQPEQILLRREGTGRMYYRLGLEYVPTDLLLEPISRGFTVLRSYRGLDDPADVWQDEDGSWHIRLGARVGIDVTLVAIGPRYHVSLVSPVPAGLELINPALAGAAPLPDPFASPWTWRYGPWYDHQQLLDERAQAVATYLPGGVYEYGIEARATAAGTFLVPPAAASETYAPETFGRGATDQVVVVASE